MDSPVRDDEQPFPAPDLPESSTSDDDGNMGDIGAGLKPAPTETSPETGDITEASSSIEAMAQPAISHTDRRLAEIISRVDVLTDAIDRYPDSPVNYVLRGEALLEGGDSDLAADDFMKALELAEPRAETANWGYLSRALADRARDGLRRAREQ